MPAGSEKTAFAYAIYSSAAITNMLVPLSYANPEVALKSSHVLLRFPAIKGDNAACRNAGTVVGWIVTLALTAVAALIFSSAALRPAAVDADTLPLIAAVSEWFDQNPGAALALVISYFPPTALTVLYPAAELVSLVATGAYQAVQTPRVRADILIEKNMENLKRQFSPTFMAYEITKGLDVTETGRLPALTALVSELDTAELIKNMMAQSKQLGYWEVAISLVQLLHTANLFLGLLPWVIEACKDLGPGAMGTAVPLKLLHQNGVQSCV